MENIIYKSFGIHLKVKNINRSLKFYNCFNFPVVFAYGSYEFFEKNKFDLKPVEEKYNGVVFKVSNSLFEIADGHLAVKEEVFQQDIISSKTSLMIVVDSVEKIIKICKENNIKIAVKIREFPWGTKEMVVKDPDGLVLVFIERLT